MEIQLTEEMFKGLFSSTIYQRGHRYYTNGRVRNFHFDPESGYWQASVQGTEQYSVRIRLDGLSLYSHCNCPAAQGSSDPCKHVAAVLLKLMEYQQSLQTEHQSTGRKVASMAARSAERERLHREEALTNRLIDRFSWIQKKESDRQRSGHKRKMQTEWTLKKDGSWLVLEMKSGVERLYVVKNIRDFILSVIDQNPFTFTKKFSFNPAEHGFLPEDLAVIDLLGKQMNYRNYRNLQYAYTGRHSITDDRQFTIPPSLFPELLTKLQSCSLFLDDSYRGHKKAVVHEHELPFAFRLDERADGDYEVDLSDLEGCQYLDDYGCLIKDGELYPLSSAQREFASHLVSIVRYDGVRALPIGKDQIEPFLSQVAPGLKKISQFSITDQVSDRIASYPLHAKVLLDRAGEQLTVQLEYHYGEAMVKPFENEHSIDSDKQIFIRDVDKEQRIMDLLESAPLTVNGNQVCAEGEDAICTFLFETLPKLEGLAEILMTNAVKEFLLPAQNTPFASIDVDSGGNWLEVNFQIDGIAEDNIQKVLQSLVEKKKYYRLPSGAFVPLEDEAFASVGQLLDELNISKSELTNQMKLPLYRGGQLESILGEQHAAIGFGKVFRRFLNRLKNPDLIDFDVPESLHAQLRDYQFYGYQWMKTLGQYGLGGILADEMGLGKTIQSIAFLLSEKEKDSATLPALIVSPASLIYNWKNELAKFAPVLHAVVASGTVQEREVLYKQEAKTDIWITSYQTLRQDISSFKGQEFSTLILDEAQTIKNFNTKTAKSVREIKARNRFALSGTPIENSIDELWSIFQTILPGFFPKLSDFKKMDPEKIARMIRPFLLRRIKKDVLSELPDKIETVHTSELTTEQKELYLAYLQKIQKETQDSLEKEGFQKSRIKILAGLTRLRQICCHPALFVEDYKGESGKLQQLLELISDALESGRRLLIFSQFTSMLAIIRDALAQQGVSFFYLDGQTRAKERVEMVDQFNQGEKNVFLISLKAGNTGLNLTGADTVILYDLWWNPAVEDQAVGRAHRIGQRNVVQVVRLITQGTIEEKIHDLQQNKRDLIESVVQSGDQSLSRLTENDIKEILNI
ncbi:SNF2 helicase associated domain-containing protein [Sporolactobacillus kofuensis]|uniref:SNF2 helicase associated domain-containing protein n=1 Tax=Sporolactobacillus kofuensis TaxID=269672 RepID=A0ABW1WG45_9BACL|nr:DEAD/DEAH box helicase [Sporolactobacillus kofuensis]MCO7176990.1 DEAD/DEAH box helicase [Sporolactobacillus kofuensis]